ncbi:hypothetical protein K4F52_001318 [Lecanicillium sp. MT-2017a]|nr:hypothetical protein K4F52_001318 [Lecanicillium sp. MT-2017a]
MSDADATAQPVEAVEQPAAPAAAEAPAATEPPAATEAPAAAPEANGDANNSNMVKTTAQIDRENYKNNRKFDPSQREISDDPAAIRKQVEFYFGDWNFPQDKFMWESCGGSENKPIPVEKIHSFKRMRTFQPYSAVVAALRDSKFLDVEGEEGKETLKRKVAYQPAANSKSKTEAATVYVKGFGDETPDTQFDLESFFAQFGEVKGIKLRRTPENLFKGSVFVTFPDEEAAKSFLAKEPAPQWKGHDLKIMSKRDYCEEKTDLIRQGKLEPSTTNSKKFYEGRENGARRDQGPRDPNDWKKRRDYDQKHGFRGGRGGRGGRGRGGRGGRGGRDHRGDRRRDDRNGDDEGNAKRPREEDAGAEEPAAKKVDTKEAVSTDA